ncbi:hypothetical protein ILUMI_19802 [Ignelater luminosus]|uniref:Adenosine/AMP deaminase N-terminal domain-containing protein n=1 Tax=Ignelater luminosus TaxID=2038154 RepID=A0A8K0CIK8_IGNLU|nr:hypothetical protein ILUMI_19802 [Ignelater luminosus]
MLFGAATNAAKEVLMTTTGDNSPFTPDKEYQTIKHKKPRKRTRQESEETSKVVVENKFDIPAEENMDDDAIGTRPRKTVNHAIKEKKRKEGNLAPSSLLYACKKHIEDTVQLSERGTQQKPCASSKLNIDSEVRHLLGNSLPLDEKELEASTVILLKKYEEYSKVFDPNEVFPPSVAFHQAKELIERSEIFAVIKKMPKGANIYGSLLSSVDFNFMYQLTFDDNLYFRFADKLYFKYSKARPGPGWRQLSYLRNTTGNPEYIEDLNNAIKECLTMSTPSSKKYEEILNVHLSLAVYKPNFMKILRRTLEILYEDNLIYAELGFQFPELYDLDGNVYNPLSVLRLCKIVVDDFIRTHKDFIGMRFIYIPDHYLSVENITQFRRTAKDLWKANPNLIAGFGITIGRESLSDWIEELLKFPRGMRLFLNTGFTKDWGIDADYNILDALVLSPASIEESYAVSKHPFVLEKLREQDIPIKFSPILAQTYNYVEDLRDHPLNILIATNYPVVIGNVGGSFVNSTGLSYEWYEAYMAMTPIFCDIRCLKQLAINSLLYSSLSLENKKKSILAWKKKWDKFIEDIILNSDQ